MKIDWTVQERDIAIVRKLLDSTKENRFVTRRIEKNVSGSPPGFSRPEVWRVMLGCLLTTQQRSGPDSSVSHFLRLNPFPLTFQSLQEKQVRRMVEEKLTRFGGIRRAPTIAEQAEANLKWLNSAGWHLVEREFNALLEQRSTEPNHNHAQRERKSALFIQENLKGFGPKQSRNLWQWLGLTRYEIPLDSRITDWLNKHIFPVRLSSQPLGDRNYYQFVMDGIQALSRASGVLPCILDAAIFSTYDRDWRPDELDN